LTNTVKPFPRNVSVFPLHPLPNPGLIFFAQLPIRDGNRAPIFRLEDRLRVLEVTNAALGRMRPGFIPPGSGNRLLNLPYPSRSGRVLADTQPHQKAARPSQVSKMIHQWVRRLTAVPCSLVRPPSRSVDFSVSTGGVSS